MQLRNTLGKILSAAGPTFKRFWASIFLTLILTSTLISTLEPLPPGYQGPYPGNRDRFAYALIPGILISWCATLFWERKTQTSGARSQTGLAGNAVSLTLGSVVTGFTYLMLLGFSLAGVSRYAAICVFLSLLFFAIPHLGVKNGLDMYVVRLFSHWIVSVLFSGVVFLGLSAIMFTISSLFSLNLRYTTYLGIWYIAAAFLAPFLFMSGIPKNHATESLPDYPKVLRNLVLFVIAPLLSVYTLVLYVYFAKILITRNWPIGLVAHLVLWYALLSTAFTLFIKPLSRDNTWAKKFSDYFPKFVIPLLFMMFASIGIRIKYYGITENRYYVTVLGLWVLGYTIYSVVSKKKRSIVMPVSLAIVTVLAVVGPWSSFSVSKWSQNNRLESLLTRNHMLSEGSIVHAQTEVDPEDYEEMAQILLYFERNHDLAQVRLLPPDFQMADFKNVFGVDYAGLDFYSPDFYLSYNAQSMVENVKDYQYMFDFAQNKYESVESIEADGFLATFDRYQQKVSLAFQDVPLWELSFRDYVQGLEPDTESHREAVFTRDDMVITHTAPNITVRTVITNLWGSMTLNPQKEITVDQVQFYLFVGKP